MIGKKQNERTNACWMLQNAHKHWCFQASMLVDNLQAIIDVNGAIASLIDDYVHKIVQK